MNIKKKLSPTAILFIATTLFAHVASAGMITEWNFSLETGFTAWEQVGGTSVGPDISPTGDSGDRDLATRLSWGVGGQQSYLDIDSFSAPPNAPLVTNGPGQIVSQVTHGNFPIQLPANHLTSTTLESFLILDPLLPDLAPLPEFSAAFDIRFDETRNNSTNAALCGDSDAATDCPDIFVLTNPEALMGEFVVDDFLYTLSISLEGFGELSDAQCAAVGWTAGCVGLLTPENGATSVFPTLRITAEELQLVPEPPVLVLAFVGLLLLVAQSRGVSRGRTCN